MPGRKTSQPQAGWAWHVHNDQLLEWCADYQSRIASIKAENSRSMHKPRLRLFQLVRAAIPQSLQQAWATYQRAMTAYEEAESARAKAESAYIQALRAFREAWCAYNRAKGDAYATISVLHQQECVADCPWDGHTIFPSAP